MPSSLWLPPSLAQVVITCDSGAAMVGYLLGEVIEYWEASSPSLFPLSFPFPNQSHMLQFAHKGSKEQPSIINQASLLRPPHTLLKRSQPLTWYYREGIISSFALLLTMWNV